MGDGDSDIPLYGGIGQVSLEPGDRKFHRKEGQYGISHAEITLGVLEIDGVNFVGHGG